MSVSDTRRNFFLYVLSFVRASDKRLLRVVLDLVYPGDMLSNILVSVKWPVVFSL
jgi:hypothetical protein